MAKWCVPTPFQPASAHTIRNLVANVCHMLSQGKARSPFSGIRIVPSAPYGPQSTVLSSSVESSTMIYVATSFTIRAYDRYGNMRTTSYCEPATIGDVPSCSDVANSIKYEIEVFQTSGVDVVDGRSPDVTNICSSEDAYEMIDQPTVLAEADSADMCSVSGGVWETEQSVCFEVMRSLPSACLQTVDGGDGTYTASYIPQYGGSSSFRVKFASTGATYLPSNEPQILTADDIYLPQTFTSFAQILVTGIAPDAGPVTGNTTVVISFQSWFIWPEDGQPNFECKFGDTSVAATFISGGTVSCVTPDVEQAQFVSVDLQVVDGPAGFTSSLVKFKYFDLPVLEPLNLDSAAKVQFTLQFAIPGFPNWVASKANGLSLFANAIVNDLAQPYEKPEVGLLLVR
eukprot:SAG31_NODE_3472_length_4234_cov_2.077872_2_plen_400_part_00